MAIVITLEQAKQQLSLMGFVAPDFTLGAIIEIVNGIDDCLDAAKYPDSTIKLIKIYSIILMLSSTDVRRVSSESGSSGSSRSYQYFDDGKASLLAMLRNLDTEGCTKILPISNGKSLIQFDVIRG